MSVQSNKPSHTRNPQVYEWIDILKADPYNEEIQTKLVKEYEQLVKSLARKFSRGSAIDDDLVQVGMVGLLGALRRFDPEFGRSFESFAVPTIIGEIKRYIRDKTWSVHVPRRIKELGPRIKMASDHLTNELQRSPRVIDIANYLNVSEEEVLETLEMSKSYRALSVDSSIGLDQESHATLLDIVGEHEEGYEQADYKMVLKEVFQALDDREQKIIQCLFFEQKSQKETGEEIGISQMHVSRLQKKALDKLRKAIRMGSSEALS